jgi:chromatin segregation and condensation protein Rec8/ScpA/Scc1 (kleisin family)
VKSLFNRKGESEKKIAFLSERRTALSQQRDRAYEEMGTLEAQEVALKEQFKDAASAISKRRVTSQMLTLRKDLERRQQLISVLNQQVNVVSTHLHNLELVQQGQVASLPNTDEMTADAVKAEEVLAELEANSELAGSVGSIASSGMSAEEQALFEELEREAGGGEKKQAAADAAPVSSPNVSASTHESVTEPAAPARQRNAAEPG